MCHAVRCGHQHREYVLTRSRYDWQPEGPPTQIRQHSIAKHNVLRTYLVEYIRTLVNSPHQEELRLTLVDGFAGGGIYQHESTRERVLGSPFVILKAVQEAEAVINLGRHKPLRMNVNYFFVEKEKEPFDLLQKTINGEGYGKRVGVDIEVLNNCFEAEAERIRKFIREKSPRSGRSIFFLDQYGYKDVPAQLIRSILTDLPSAEIILTFNVDSFINYATDSPVTTSLLQQIGIPDALRGRTFEDIKKSEKDFRLFIQSSLYRGLVEACGARYYTVFFIRTDGHGDYWLVHLSQHPRARDVMTRVHWEKNNNFIHYGGAGIDMFQVLGYSADRDSSFTGQARLGFCFDDPAAEASVAALMEQLPRIIYSSEGGISFGELFATTCNTSPADSRKYKQALATLVKEKEIEIVTSAGGRRSKPNRITEKDQLLPPRQRNFLF